MRIGYRPALLAAVAAVLLAAPAAAGAAPLGRVVALGDSLASGQNLGPQAPGSPTDCGRSTGGYPEVAMSRVTHGTWVNATCNATTTDNFQYGWTGPSGAVIPPQYDSLNGTEDLVIVGSGNNEAFFGKIAYDCSGYQPAVDAFFHNRDHPQETPWPIPNHCTDTYVVNGVNQIPNYVALAKPKITAALTRIHQLSPNAKIILVGKPRLAKPSGSQCFSSEFWLTAADAPLYATWEDGVEQAMIDTVNAFNSSVPGNYAHFVDMQAISGTSHTACETNASDRWMNPHPLQSGPGYPGIPLHHTPLGASVTANAIVDSIHAYGFDTGATATNPVVSISSPASGTLTTNATIPINFSATDNIRIASCNITSGASVALSPGANTIVVTCLDDAGNSGSASVTVMRDATPPVISISSPANGSGTTAASTQLVYTATDDVGTPNCTPASGTTFALSTGANSLSVSCTDSVGRNSTSSITVYRGTPPVVAISAPATGTKTASATVNVSYTVNGAATIPSGTTCKVNGTSSGSATTNSASLAVGTNSIVVDCTSIFGSGSSSVTVTRGDPPVVAITAPAPGTNTTAANVNVAFTVGGSTSIPGGTTCTVGGSSTSSTTANPISLALGANTISVVCTNAFGSGSDSVTVTRGNPPVVAITSPSNGVNTSAASANVTYTVDGGSSIPPGTSCTVNGSGSSGTTSNSVTLALGSNTITVACTNPFGSASGSITVNRGNAPVVAITVPADALKTTATSTNVSFTVDGAASIPNGTTCTVGGASTASATANPFSLALGTNSITVACTNAFGSNSTAVTVTRGLLPSVAITAPSNGLNTTATSVNVTYIVDGGSSIPSGTSCTVNGSASAGTTSNSVALALGANTITVVCTNAFGNTSSSISVNRGNAPVVAITAPADGMKTTAASVNATYTIDGGASIPSGTSCTVNGAASATTSSNNVTLALGANSITVSCTNAFGSSSVAVTVTRGVVPVVAITAPSNGLNTTASSVNVTYTVDGGSSIPSGTSCTVNGSASAGTSSNSVTLSLGSNTITVSCTNAFGSTSSSITVNRGNPPVVAITAPAPGTNTTSATANVSFTVGGSTSIPSGTTCTVGGSSTSSATANPVSLALGANAISVACTNAFGSGSSSVTVNRGNPPVVAITSPSNGLNTTASSVNVTYSVDGGSSIPSGTTCTVNGSGSSSTASNSVALVLGANTITLACTNAFGSTSGSITVNRGNPPVVAVTAPADGLKTTATSVNAAYTVGGSSSIPSGTNCTVNGAASAGTTSNSVALALGANTITVSCTNAFGGGSAAVTVTRGVAPVVAIAVPVDNTVTSAASVNVVFSLNGAASIPGGTTCSVNGVATTSTTTNSVALAIGSNAITVTCTSAFGTDADTVTVVRGTGPSVTITAPGSGLNTTASSTNVAFTVDGAASIPNGTTCTVNGVPTSSAGTNTLSLALGTNTIEVACSNALGDDTQSVIVYRGNPPVVAITAPAAGLKTTAASVNAAYTIDGGASIPSGTSCTVNGSASAATSLNNVTLALGPNSITASCTNAFGSGSAAVTVTRGVVPVVAITAPSNGLNTTASSVNVTYTVDAGSSIPSGTSCTVNGSASAGTSSNNLALALGSNTITVVCTNAFGNASSSISVNRGNAPIVAVTSPANGLKTTATSVNVAYTVGGAGTLPGGTTCTVNGSASAGTTSNSVALAFGANSITVSCTNAFGTGSDAITVTRGNTPTVAITAPQGGAVTSLAGLSASFTVDGSDAIPAGTTCSVGGVATTDPSGTSVALALGANSITVSCTNAFGDGSDFVSVTRVAAPIVAIVYPASGTVSELPSVAISFLVNGAAAIPDGTTCSVGGVPTPNTAAVSVALAPGSNTITVSCTDAYGSSDAQSLEVTYTAPIGGDPSPPAPTPPQPTPTKELAAPTISSVSPNRLRPLRSGADLSTRKRRSAAKFRVTLGSAAAVRLSIERLDRGRTIRGGCAAARKAGASGGSSCTLARRASKWRQFKLAAGRSTIYVSGRARGRALRPGRYRVRMIVSGSGPAVLGRSFRVVR